MDYTGDECWKDSPRDNKDILNKFYANLKVACLELHKEWRDEVSKMQKFKPRCFDGEIRWRVHGP